MSDDAGVLSVVATPIGHLGDMTPRAVETLAAADIVACEDTRRLRTLARHFGITLREVVVVDEHREEAATARLTERLLDGAHVALTTDAGTPLVSDPGYRLVVAAIEAGIRIEPIPGASAVLASLVVAGLPTDRFVMEGFLPRRGRGRAERLADIAVERRTTVVFDSPRRLADTLADLELAAGPSRRVVVCRELTKTFEEVWRGTLGDAVAHWSDVSVKGECVVVIAGAQPEDADDATLAGALAELHDAGLSRRDAVDRVSARFGVRRNRVYELATRASDGADDGSVADRD